MFDLDDNVQTLDMEVQEVVQTKGEDGFSPIATVTQTSSGATISITDKNGTTSAEVKNGANGEVTKDNLDDMGYLMGVTYTVVAEENGYVRANGTISTSTSARRTDYFDCSNYSKIEYVNGISNSGFALAFFDSNKNILSDVSIIGNNTWKKTFADIPTSAKYCIFSLYRTSSTEIKLYKNIEQTSNIRKKYNRISAYDIASFGSFRKFGVIGDSLSVGCYQDSSETIQTRNIEYSWGRQLARKLGNTCLNFGMTGVTSKTWFDFSNCYNAFINEENKCQAYIIGLGANDASSSGFTVGTLADVDFDNMDNNADTFFGWYSKILRLCNTTNSLAHVFVFTMPYPRDTSTTKSSSINSAIRTLATDNHFTNIHLIDLEQDWNYFFKDCSLYNDNSQHFNAMDYAHYGLINGYVISDYMDRNYSKFIEIPKIPFGNATIIE